MRSRVQDFGLQGFRVGNSGYQGFWVERGQGSAIGDDRIKGFEKSFAKFSTPPSSPRPSRPCPPLPSKTPPQSPRGPSPQQTSAASFPSAHAAPRQPSPRSPVVSTPLVFRSPTLAQPPLTPCHPQPHHPALLPKNRGQIPDRPNRHSTSKPFRFRRSPFCVCIQVQRSWV